ncbi:cation:proton antiporter [Amycolatopsis samaneae]|uniref:Cation:proton antiporter n=1 Tax=Amycolatopsis samaneae TaxID=664691 RepID=A0ABW5GRG7_9PSEU
MNPVGGAGLAQHVVLALAAVLLLAFLGRLAARRLRQPVVIGEIALGLAVGPLVLAAGGPRLLEVLLPPAVLDWLRFVGHAGLVLFVIGVAHELRRAREPVGGRSVGWTVVGAVAVPLAMGGILATWVLVDDDPALRGTAPPAALVVLLAVSLAVTAVPVLARILEDRELTGTRLGRLSMTVAVITDGLAWLLLAVAIGLATGGMGNVSRVGIVIIVALLGAAGCWALLRTPSANRFAARFPSAAAVVIAAGGLVLSGTLQHLGLTEIFGALLVGLAIPTGRRQTAWHTAVRTVTDVGRRIVPVFFVVTGVTVFARRFDTLPWAAMVLATVLGVLGKVGGGYLGARMGREPPDFAMRMGVLLNARGLTELVVLQAGYSAGILTSGMYLALVVMALVATVVTGPVDALLARKPLVALGNGAPR